MKSLNIICDVDDILCEMFPAWLAAIGDVTGVYAKVSDIVDWDLHKLPPLNTVDSKVIFGLLKKEGFYAGLQPLPGAIEGVRKLAKAGHQVYFVTARNGPVAVADTYKWFAQWLPDVPINRINFFADKWLIDADVIIDDRAETLERYWGAHPYAQYVGLQYPHNKRLWDIVHYRMFENDDGRGWDKICKLVHTIATDD